MTNWKVGMEAVYVEDGSEWETNDGKPPVILLHKKVYIISGLDKSYYYRDVGELGLFLEGFGYRSFDSTCFRPVKKVRKKTSIAIFKKMLTPSPTPTKQQEPVEI